MCLLPTSKMVVVCCGLCLLTLRIRIFTVLTFYILEKINNYRFLFLFLNISRWVLVIILLSQIEFTPNANDAYCFSFILACSENTLVFNSQKWNCKHFSYNVSHFIKLELWGSAPFIFSFLYIWCFSLFPVLSWCIHLLHKMRDLATMFLKFKK